VLLDELQKIKDKKKIPLLVLCSAGGDIPAGLCLHDQIKLQFKDLIIIGSGALDSIAINIFLAAKRENRFITNSTTAYLHEAGYYKSRKSKRIAVSDEKFSDLPRDIRESLCLSQKISSKIIKKATLLSGKKLRKLEKRGTNLNAKQIIKYGFASKIITSLNELVSN
jgi:ATP-dependent protease ClpP protease subunit